MYCIIKQLWLHHASNSSPRAGVSPQKRRITSVYQRLAQRITVDDPVLSKLGIPLLKINTKCLSEFIRRQEALSGKNVTDQGLSLMQRCESIANTDQASAIELPDMRPVTSRPHTEYPVIPNLAGTRSLKVRRDHFAAITSSASQTSSTPSTHVSSIPASVVQQLPIIQQNINPATCAIPSSVITIPVCINVQSASTSTQQVRTHSSTPHSRSGRVLQCTKKGSSLMQE